VGGPAARTDKHGNVRACLAALQQLSTRELRLAALAEDLQPEQLDRALAEAQALGVTPKDSMIAAILRQMMFRHGGVQEAVAATAAMQAGGELPTAPPNGGGGGGGGGGPTTRGGSEAAMVSAGSAAAASKSCGGQEQSGGAVAAAAAAAAAAAGGGGGGGGAQGEIMAEEHVGLLMGRRGVLASLARAGVPHLMLAVDKQRRSRESARARAMGAAGAAEPVAPSSHGSGPQKRSGVKV
jgi:hypothetical protein